MKGEYVDAKNQSRHNHSSSATATTIFSKLHPQHSHHHHQQQQQQQQLQQQHPHHHQMLHPFANHFQQQQVTSTTSEEADDTATTTTTTNTTPQPQQLQKQQPSDGATIEVVRRPRGRPPGSKNKPRPPVIITRDTEQAMSPYILEVPGGNDIVDAISRFCRRKAIGLCILTGSGTVSNVTLRQPSTTPGTTVTFHGRFDILSLTATFLPHAPTSLPNAFTISLAGPQGQIVGGLVAGALLAAGTVYVVAASFNNPSYHRLPPTEDDGREATEGNSPAGSAGGGESAGHAPAVAGDLGMYGCHVAQPDVIWAPTARQPQQPPPPPPGY